MSSINPTFDADAAPAPTSPGVVLWRYSDGNYFNFNTPGWSSTPVALAVAQIGSTGVYAAGYDTTAIAGSQFAVDQQYLYIPWDIGNNARWQTVGAVPAWVVAGSDQYGPATVSLSGGQITSIANAIAAALNASGVTLTSGQVAALTAAVASSVAAIPVESGVSLVQSLQCAASFAAGNIAQPPDGSTSTLSAAGNPSTTRLTSTNTATTRTVTLH